MQLTDYHWDNFVFCYLKATLTSQYPTCHSTQHLQLDTELWIKWHLPANRVILWKSMVYSDLNGYIYGWYVEYRVWKNRLRKCFKACFGVTDWGNGWVMDTIYGNPLLIKYSSVHVRFIRYMNVDVRWCTIYPLGSFVHVQSCERQPMDSSSGVLRSLSVPNLFCSVLVHYVSGTRAVHIRAYPAVVHLCTTMTGN